MPSIDDKNDTEEEDMEQDTPDSEKSDDEETESGTASEGEESSELDEEECDRRRTECLDEMANLERQFGELKEQLYQERMHQVEVKLDEVQAGKTSEYLKPVAQLQENMRIRTQVAGILRELRKDSIFKKYESEDLAAKQNYESEKMLLYDQVKQDLEDKIRRLEEDRHNIDINSDLWNESQSKSKKNKKKHDPFSPDRRKKPVTVSGPYIVYMLKDLEIIEDLTTIKKALKQRQRKKSELYRKEKQPYHARYDDGKLFYEGEWYSKGHRIVIDNKEDSPVDATITAINTGEVWVKRADGNKSKLYIMQLQKGKYTIRHITY